MRGHLRDKAWALALMLPVALLPAATLARHFPLQ
jgi:hypothetical protein